MDVREGVDASLYCVLETFGRVGVGKMHSRLHGGQHVLNSVFGFARENGDMRLVTFALRYIARDFRRADDFAFRILDRRNGQRNIDTASVLARTNCFIGLDSRTASDTFENRCSSWSRSGGIKIVTGLPTASSAV